MRVPYNIIIDLDKPTRRIEFDVVRGDDRARSFIFQVITGGKRLDLSDIGVVEVKGAREDGTIIYNEANVEGDKIIWNPSSTYSNVVGKMTVTLTLMSNDTRQVTSFDIYINVVPQLFDETDYLSENDLAGFKSMLVRAGIAANAAEGVMRAFVETNGTLREIRDDYEETLRDYGTWFSELKAEKESGKLNGARGAQGENGHDAIMSTESGIVGFHIEDGHLMCYYYSDDEPPMRIDERGHLIFE